MRSLGHEPPLPGTVLVDPTVASAPTPAPAEPAAPGENAAATPAAAGPADSPVPPAPTAEAGSEAAAPGASFFTRRELIDQQLADDAEQLAKIDEMIRAVNTAFPLLDPALAATLPDPLAQAAGDRGGPGHLPGVLAAGLADDPDALEADEADEPDNAAAREANTDDEREPEEL